jgi:hypothetical protein
MLLNCWSASRYRNHYDQWAMGSQNSGGKFGASSVAGEQTNIHHQPTWNMLSHSSFAFHIKWRSVNSFSSSAIQNYVVLVQLIWKRYTNMYLREPYTNLNPSDSASLVQNYQKTDPHTLFDEGLHVVAEWHYCCTGEAQLPSKSNGTVFMELLEESQRG